MDKPIEKSIRDQYAAQGVENFYLEHGHDYVNPHLPQIEQLLVRNQHRIDYSSALDFCCGGGEVTTVLAGLGFSNTIGCDPFTQQAFKNNTLKEALSFNFSDVIQGKLTGDFSTIICSFAMHLCPHDQLFLLTYYLFAIAPQIVIITPHKRPALEDLDGVGVEFEDFALTKRAKKVRLKAYRKAI
jgi:hypothetical protein